MKQPYFFEVDGGKPFALLAYGSGGEIPVMRRRQPSNRVACSLASRMSCRRSSTTVCQSFFILSITARGLIQQLKIATSF